MKMGHDAPSPRGERAGVREHFRVNWKGLGLIGMMALVAPCLSDLSSTVAPIGYPSVNGSFAFYYAPRLTEQELAWFRRFQIVVPGAVLPSPQILELKRGGTKLFFYHWLTGFYLDGRPGKPRDGSWESFVYHTRPGWLLNPNQPDAGPDGQGRAYYYDPCHPDLQLAWARQLSQRLQSSSYDGIFFDLVGSFSLPPHLQAVYKARHPDTPYDQALSGALRALKRMRPEALIFTNQGYRTPQAYLPLADYDLSESLMTSYAWGEVIKLFVEGEGLVEKQETYYRPWEELERIIDSIEADVKQHNPAVKLFHLNYVNPLYRPTGKTEIVAGKSYPVFRKELDRPAIYYGYAAAKLWGRESYSQSLEGIRFSRDEIYFADLGKPLGEGYEERGGMVRRYYEKGVVALIPSEAGKTADLGSPFIPSRVKGLWDCYRGKAVEGFTVTLEPTVSSASGHSYPAGGVYLYLWNTDKRR